MPETNSRYQVAQKENLQGVYTVNNGFAAFRLIEIIGENNTFYIISSKMSGGVRLYDQVIRNGSNVKEGDKAEVGNFGDEILADAFHKP